MLIAQITDLHIGFDRGNPHELNVRRLNLVIDELNELQPRPELLLVTGDLVENGDDVDAYQHMHALVGRWQGPKIWAIGNHDDRDDFRPRCRDVPTDANGFVQYEVRILAGCAGSSSTRSTRAGTAADLRECAPAG